ncbi:MAG TPA: DNA-formamidopyrimidine glycosylase family protein, partial [Acidimicrobiales bacterium]|nr:DNA-formamidopyrimidine glycosylase family protein [Acidimicrobiales bacterium]
MPELLEIEAYRRLAEPVVGRVVGAVAAPDPWFVKGGVTADDLGSALVGARVVGLRRHGKLLCVDLAGPEGPRPVLGLRFGMTGRLIVDGRAGIERLEYGSDRGLPEWDRFTV